MNIDAFHAYFLDRVKPIIDSIVKADSYSIYAEESREIGLAVYGEYSRDSRLYSEYACRFHKNYIVADILLCIEDVKSNKTMRFRLNATDAEINERMMAELDQLITVFIPKYNYKINRYRSLPLL